MTQILYIDFTELFFWAHHDRVPVPFFFVLSTEEVSTETIFGNFEAKFPKIFLSIKLIVAIKSEQLSYILIFYISKQ